MSPESLEIWKKLHWSFFSMIQALNIGLQRFEQAILTKNLALAQIELESAATLMLASGAAMELAASFNPADYNLQIRATMLPPYVESDNFSGLMSWDHFFLIAIWMRLKPIFENLPCELESSHERFVLAYKSLAHAHKGVCSKFGGDEKGSIRSDSTKNSVKKTAVETLEQFEKNRERLLDPNIE
ncbi:siderophore biosynthesis protein [Nostoc sp. KVJ3]|uniref:siderophore biosynthesis protein n=1 Tax=Nostoc sp. KVJ3 TaxID=457945 RepID=UPI0022383BCE|nr:siderophore biosynthesis protein [Nostoc sp. KVJ3]MCW5319439.1 siderophore biosynthesis protein [Nostoc sp. KVJ3]